MRTAHQAGACGRRRSGARRTMPTMRGRWKRSRRFVRVAPMRGSRRRCGRALAHLRGALRTPRLLARGLGWRGRITRSAVPWIRATDLRAIGDDALREIFFRADGRERREPADTLLLHDGVVPSVQITRAL